jgi:hypothetical protein
MERLLACKASIVVTVKSALTERDKRLGSFHQIKGDRGMTPHARAEQIELLYAMGFDKTAFYYEVLLLRDMGIEEAEVHKISRIGIHKGNI